MTALHCSVVVVQIEVPRRAAAHELRLSEAAESGRMFLVQLPSVLNVQANKAAAKAVKPEPGIKEEPGTSAGAYGAQLPNCSVVARVLRLLI